MSEKVKLTQEQQIIVAAVIEGVKESLKHECFFEAESRKKIHAFVDAIDEAGATHGTHILILRAGRAWQDVTTKLASVLAWGLIVIVAVIITIFFGKPVLNWMKGM